MMIIMMRGMKMIIMESEAKEEPGDYGTCVSVG